MISLKRCAALFLTVLLAVLPGFAAAEELERSVDMRRQYLYEESVQQKYKAFLDEGYHNYLMSDGLFACSQIYQDIEDDSIGKNLAKWAARFMGEGLDRDQWAKYLVTQLTMQESGFSDAAQSLAEYDTLKSLTDYTTDAVGIVTGALDLKNFSETALNVISDLLGMSSDLLGGTAQALDQYRDILKLAKTYENHSLVLSAIRNNTGDEHLQAACDDLLSTADQSLQLQADALGRLALEGYATVASNIFMPDMLEYMQSLPEYESDESFKKMVNAETSFVEGYKLFNLFFDLTNFGGDMILGTTDVYKRYSEIVAINEMIKALEAEIVKGMTDPYAGGEEVLQWARKYVPLMQAITLLRLRGEYCAVSMVYYDAQGASLFQRIFGEFEAAIDFYQDRRQFLETCWEQLNELLVAPPPEAYRYNFNSRDVLRADLDGDGLMDALGCTQEQYDASVNVITSGHDKFSFVRRTMVPEGSIIGADLGDGDVTLVISLAMGGTAGSVHLGMYRPGDCVYIPLDDVFVDYEFPGTVGSDGATATVTTPSGETFQGKMSVSWDQLAGDVIHTDPIYYVEHVYVEEQECYDLVTLQSLWPDEMHNAGAGVGCTQYHLQDGEFVVVKQWVEFY